MSDPDKSAGVSDASDNKPCATPLLDRFFEWAKSQPKCSHDGKSAPCTLCLIREAQAKHKEQPKP